MIFNEEFDKVLELILYIEEDKRDRIVEFIKDIPYELKEVIDEALNIYDESKSRNIDIYDMDLNELTGEIFVSNNYKYWFNVDMNFGTLNIGRSNNNILDIDITLYSNSNYDINDDQVLGYVNYNNLDNNSVCYEIRNTLFGRVVMSSKTGKFRKCRKINEGLYKNGKFVRSKVRK